MSVGKGNGMFLNAKHRVFELVKDLMRNMTYAEKYLWFYLKESVNDFKFNRQHPWLVYR